MKKKVVCNINVQIYYVRSEASGEGGELVFANGVSNDSKMSERSTAGAISDIAHSSIPRQADPPPHTALQSPSPLPTSNIPSNAPSDVRNQSGAEFESPPSLVDNAALHQSKTPVSRFSYIVRSRLEGTISVLNVNVNTLIYFQIDRPISMPSHIPMWAAEAFTAANKPKGMTQPES